jgi:hypothetical protein
LRRERSKNKSKEEKENKARKRFSIFHEGGEVISECFNGKEEEEEERKRGLPKRLSI